MTIQAHAFLKSGEKFPAKLTLESHKILIACNGDTERWNLSTCIGKIGGAADKLFFISSSESLLIESVYFPRDKENLSILAQYDHPLFLSLLEDNKKKKLFGRLSFSSIIAGIGLLALIFYLIWAPMLGYLARMVPYSVEKEIGNRLIGFILPKTKTLDRPLVLNELKKQLQPLLLSMPEEMRDVQFYISTDGDINAFAIPGGHIVFNKGLLENAASIEEVLGVAAHELAHVKQRHSLQSLFQSIGVFFAIDIFIGDYSGLIAIMTDQSQLLLQRGFSREFELESDNIGFDLLVKNRISPTGMISFFKTLEKEAKKNQNELDNMLSFLSTHPGTEERIEKLSLRIENLDEKFEAINLNYNDLKQALIEIPTGN